MPKPAPALDSWNIQFALGYLEDEHETLLALAITLMNRLEPTDPANPAGDDDITSWRLSQVLHARITDVTFIKNMRQLLGQPTEKTATV